MPLNMEYGLLSANTTASVRTNEENDDMQRPKRSYRLSILYHPFPPNKAHGKFHKIHVYC